MTQRVKNIFVLAAICFALFISGFSSASAAEAFTDEQKAEIKQVIKQYLKEEPVAVFEAMQRFQQQQEEDMTKLAESRIAENKEALTSKDLPSAGNPDGDVTIIEFYDYNCGFCKRAMDDVTKAIENDNKIRVVFHELAILGPPSEIAARWSVAAHKQGKFLPFHIALMHNTGSLDEAALTKTATNVGLDVEKLKADASSKEVKDAVAKSRDLAMTLQIHGTPGFIINDTLYRGYLGAEGLANAIAEARKPKEKE